MIVSLSSPRSSIGSHFTIPQPVHSVSLSVTSLASYYNISKTSVTTSITLTLLFRSAGAALFGVAGDYWGRKWPMCVRISGFHRFHGAHAVRPLNRVINMFIIGALQIGTIYAKTYGQFLAVRALFGIGMYFILLGAWNLRAQSRFNRYGWCLG